MTRSWLDERLPEVEEIRRRLARVIPGAQDPQGWIHRELAAKTVFVMLYGYAVEGHDRWIRPTAVTDMTDEQAARQDPESRKGWLDEVQGRGRPQVIPGRWYSENTRESIRDETLRSLVQLGVVVERAACRRRLRSRDMPSRRTSRIYFLQHLPETIWLVRSRRGRESICRPPC